MILEDGFSTKITFTDFASVAFSEREVTPPSIQGGGPINTTTMDNTAWRTAAAKKLKQLTESGMTVTYDAVMLSDIQAMINHNQLITVNIADGSLFKFWGFVDQFNPGPMSEGNQPTATVRIEPTNRNAAGVETAPSFTAAP